LQAVWHFKGDIEGQSRRAKFTKPRQIAMPFAASTPPFIPEIGRRSGIATTTCLHAFHKITRLAASDALLAAQLDELGAENSCVSQLSLFFMVSTPLAKPGKRRSGRWVRTYSPDRDYGA